MTVAEKEKSKVPQLRFPEFRGRYVINRVAEIANIFRGKDLSKSDVESNGKFDCILYGESFA